jgi:hypothetical protein
MQCKSKVVIATPASLFCLLKSCGVWQATRGTRQERPSDKRTWQRTLQSSFSPVEPLEHLRDSLVSAHRFFDATVGSLESRALPSVRAFKQILRTKERPWGKIGRGAQRSTAECN